MSTAPKQPKAQRQAEQRAAQLETFKKRQAAAKRNRVLVIALSVLGALAVVALVATVIVINIQPKAPAGPIGDVQLFPDLDGTHVPGDVVYPMSPPAGGQHNDAWLNCGVYTEPQRNEYAVHSLQHGAIWITYNPDLAQADIDTLKSKLPSSYAILSPYPGLDAPIAISAWGAQLKLTDPADSRIDDFFARYWRAGDSPEPNASCSGAIDGPGKE